MIINGVGVVLPTKTGVERHIVTEKIDLLANHHGEMKRSLTLKHVVLVVLWKDSVFGICLDVPTIAVPAF